MKQQDPQLDLSLGKAAKERIRRLRSYEADFTPPLVVLQGLQWVKFDLGVREPFVLDPAAGAGVFAMMGRIVWPGSIWHAVEPREEEAEHVKRWNHRHYAMTLERALEHPGPLWLDTERFPLIVTNPPLSLAPFFLDRLIDKLTPDGWLVLYLPTQWGQEGEAANMFQRWPPAATARVTGRVQHRPGGGTDRITYSWWAWRSGVMPSHASLYTLPELRGPERRWRIRPGTETQQELALLLKGYRAAAARLSKENPARRR